MWESTMRRKDSTKAQRGQNVCMGMGATTNKASDTHHQWCPNACAPFGHSLPLIFLSLFPLLHHSFPS